MDTLETILGIAVLALASAGASAVLALDARQAHPRLRSLALLLGYCALLSALRLFTAIQDRTGILMAEDGSSALPHLFAYSPYLYILNALNSLLSNQVSLLLFAKLACICSGSDWKGPRAFFYRALALAYTVETLAALVIVPASGSVASADAFDLAKAYVMEPLLVIGYASAFIDCVIRLESSPWPQVAGMVRKTWPAFALLSLAGFFDVFFPLLSAVKASAVLLGAGMCAWRCLAANAGDSSVAHRDTGRGLEAGMAKLGLSAREREACGLFLDGWERPEIARRLSISKAEAAAALQGAFEKTKAPDKQSLAAELRRGA
jgi:DNA-binding CsgD family transcriptional regulator